ncbi:hypothetical protein [Verminephrobacter aporrectodeae]|uniref:hypothetical protein n=1 Tax=Verminephrobacter aporrectodeae TaxID=1110389 RepID=UPI001110517A|nr:hypothetical protein [Verminephrobacter aporrectodeae]
MLLTAYGQMRLSATPVPPTEPPDVARLAAVWAEEKSLGYNGDAQALGMAAFQIAARTHLPEWAGEALRQSEIALEKNAQSPLVLAYLGATHAIVARDFPVAPALQVFLGPGFVRLYHVWRSLIYLDAAVASAPLDPVVRLVRASTMLGLPKLFGQHDKGLADLRLIQSWMAHPQDAYAGMLADASFQREVLAVAVLALPEKDKTPSEPPRKP